MIIDHRTVGPFQENAYLVTDPVSLDAVLIDPGDEPETLVAMVRARGAMLRAIWLTHAHLDHIGGIAGVKRLYDVPVLMHPLDQPLYENGNAQAAGYGVPFEQPGPVDGPLAEGDRVSVGALTFEVWHLPGHAPGHVAFLHDGVVLGGDLLFAGSIGRTDFPGCDAAAMVRSLARLAALPSETVVYPGHGAPTTIGEENRSNPFLTGVARIPRR
jgi:glyoxylase-like metal-dependent hydrolase (beta-lactamase superfamily II)